MKRILIISLLAPFFGMAQPEASDNGEVGVRFIENMSWAEIVQQAKAQHKYIFVDCYATWCGPCKAMDNSVYPLDSVGDIVNQSFVSARIQCDTARGDGELVKARYGDAHRMVTKYQVNAYPTFLFFTPDGEIVHKGLGYYGPQAFIGLLKDALDKNTQYFTLQREYENGKMAYSKMVKLAETARRFRNNSLFSSIAGKIVREHLDSLSDFDLCQKDNLDLIVKFEQGIGSGDRVFGWLLQHPALFDSVIQKKGYGTDIINNVIYKEEVSAAIQAGKQGGGTPDWNAIGNNIDRKYGNGHAVVLYKGEMHWYEFKNDSENLCAAAVGRIETGGYARDLREGVNQEILNQFAWNIFQYSNDRRKLEKALTWAILVEGTLTDSSGNFAGVVLDTKANLLYKLGKRKEALPLEIRAHDLYPAEKAITASLQKMKEGKPTW
jgi:thioredoxin-related protein